MRKMGLTKKKCAPCEGGTPPMQIEEAKKLLQQVQRWQLLQINDTDAIEKGFKFEDFAEAMKFVNRVAEIAEEQGHHPGIKISWNRVTLQLTTHAIKGLSENESIENRPPPVKDRWRNPAISGMCNRLLPICMLAPSGLGSVFSDPDFPPTIQQKGHQ